MGKRMNGKLKSLNIVYKSAQENQEMLCAKLTQGTPYHTTQYEPLSIFFLWNEAR